MSRLNIGATVTLILAAAAVPFLSAQDGTATLAGTWIGPLAGTGLQGKIRFTLNSDGSLRAGHYTLPGSRRFRASVTGNWTQHGNHLDVHLQSVGGDPSTTEYDVLGRSGVQLILRAPGEGAVLWTRVP